MDAWPQPRAAKVQKEMTASPVLWKGVQVPQFTDAYARSFYYLRLSVTDVCNFRCTYCLPDGYRPNGAQQKFSHRWMRFVA
ncbi:hypothetical protein E05_08710 [Plautia stali symbiont]|nr:hypothetical protein E05_08710 [Plautia stali symbiont]